MAGNVSTQTEEELILEILERLFPLHRSVAGPGLRETLAIISEYVPLTQTDVPTGTPILDWIVPREWKIRDGWIASRGGRRIVDYQASNLNVVSHSTPVPRQLMPMTDLRSHLHTTPGQPHLTPYKSSPYDDAWGFCLAQETLDQMEDLEYEVCIDSALADGALSYGEVLVPGTTGREFILSAHTCHPSLADDNLSGIAVAIIAARRLLERGNSPAIGLRVIFAPGTIGTVAWLANNQQTLQRVVGGLTLVCLGDEQPLAYKRTIRGDTAIDQAAAAALEFSEPGSDVLDYHPWGYDERQYNSPGIDLPVGSLMRGRHGQFPEYHTSGDSLDFVSAGQIAAAARVVDEILKRFQATRVYRNLQGEGEPQLGRRGLFRRLGGSGDPEAQQLAILWLLALADGRRTLEQIAERAGVSLEIVESAAAALVESNLLIDIHSSRLR